MKLLPGSGQHVLVENTPMRTSLSHNPVLNRLRGIELALGRHGIVSPLVNLHRECCNSLSPRFLKRAYNAHISPAEHIRFTLKELGLTFIKLGQLISTRRVSLARVFI